MKFYLDSFKGEFEGENRGFWNGWACPVFSKSEAFKIMDMFNTQNNGVSMSYDNDKKSFLVIIKGADDEEYDETKDGLYAIGAWNWCWDIREDNNENI